MNPWPFKHRFDFIFCRNVVIYFDEPTKTNSPSVSWTPER
ncbi:hypothetical protein E6W36_07890 [Hankyongella ginsenosidimutans]|uniref:MCP methyltransferase CheR-type SAM-binding domain-containing protein n=2 Tax=Hankyongella ginsenosidimutans TaxID=1763828 RepID=A0A4D7C9D1_9SPHN|nr:hypothetical protein E6W36_07890 [Hankyongella ginsenosidimutans]